MSYTNFNTFKLFENVGINSSSDYMLSMKPNDNNISFHSSNSIDYNNVDIMSIKNIINKKQNEDLNLSSLTGTTINPVIKINNNHSDCRIMTNLNVSGNLNINSTGYINLSVGTTSERPSNPNLGTIRYNNETHTFEGYANGSWVNLSTPSSLYTFSSHTFTSAGISGKTGPTLTQLINAYVGNVWTINTEFFYSVYEGYQLWTVPQTGNYRIKAYGAGGGFTGNAIIDHLRRGPGKGAITQGNFSLNKGEKLLIIVGQTVSPTLSGDIYAGGGGGATWVLRGDQWETIDSNLYCVAGGGGGEGERDYLEGTSITVEDAGTSQSSLITDWSSNQSTGITSGGVAAGGGGSYGIKGGEGNSLPDNGGGGGVPFDSTLAIGGVQPVNYGGSNVGGFGGGGGSSWSNGGGGGGYKGGDSGKYNLNGGEGGSSRNNGTSILFENHSGANGAVEITFIPEISTSPLYDFTSFTFTNCNKTGKEGPTLTQARSAYTDTWTDNNTYFNVVNGIQYWTVPKSGNYRIKAYGATGTWKQGGKGAIIRGDFTLVRGEIIRILVGQKPKETGMTYSGGAGGTFVVKAPYNTDSSILVIAGGGGGNNNHAYTGGLENKHGQSPAVGGPGGAGVGPGGTNSNPNYSNYGGINGSAGTNGYGNNAGAGFHYSVSDVGTELGAKAFTHPTTPGVGGSQHDSEGGFGGGGNAKTRAGGGGGYSGGAGPANSSGSADWLGGGGGSYNNGFNQTEGIGDTNGWDNEGKVEITFIS